MYSAKVKASMSINLETGEKILRTLEIDAGDYSNREVLDEATTSYNQGRSLPSMPESSGNYPEHDFVKLCSGTFDILEKWRNRYYRKYKKVKEKKTKTINF